MTSNDSLLTFDLKGAKEIYLTEDDPDTFFRFLGLFVLVQNYWLSQKTY